MISTMLKFGAACLAIIPAIYVHSKIAGDEEFVGSIAMLDRVFDLAFVCGLAVLTFGVGNRIARALQLEFLSVAEELSFSIMLGTGGLGLSILLIGLVGLLKPLPVAVFILFVLIGIRSELAKFPQIIRKIFITAVSTPQYRLLSALYLIVILILVIRAATPPWAIDDVIYHLPATRSFVQEGRVFPLYHQPLGNMPFLIHMIYALCLLAKTDIAAKLFSLLLMSVTSVALYAFCRRFFDSTIGFVAMFGLLAASMVVEVGVTTRIDVSLAGMLFLATYAMIIHLETGRRNWLFTSAILSGFSLGIKLNALLWIGCVVLIFLFESVVRLRRNILSVAKTAALYALITFTLASPWLLKNLVWFHNPVYPFITGELAEFNNGNPRYFNLEDERKLDAHFDAARNAGPNDFQRIREVMDQAAKKGPQRHPMRFWEYYTKPDKYFMGDFYHYPSSLFLILPFFFMVLRRRWITWLLLLSIISFLVLSLTAWIARFLLLIYPPLTIVSAYTLVELARRFTGRWAARICFYVVATFVIIQLNITISYITEFEHLKFISGASSRAQFLSELFYYPPIDFINRNVPPGAGVLSVGGEMCYHMRRPYISDGSWDGTEWRRLLVRNASFESLSTDLKNQGITHILFARWYFKAIAEAGWPKPGGSPFLASGRFTDPARLVEFGADYHSLRNWVIFDRYRRDYLELVYTDQNGYEIYRLK
jgi:4-amino-4-deoxy-L-arabinose transferase-like glycosyltransferase